MRLHRNHSRLRPVLDPLESRQLLSITTPEIEPNNTRARPTEVRGLDRVDGEAILTGRLNPAGDVDYFHFRSALSTSVRVFPGAASVTVLDRTGAPIPGGSPGTAASTVFRVGAGQDVYVRVSAPGRTPPTAPYAVVLDEPVSVRRVSVPGGESGVVMEVPGFGRVEGSVTDPAQTVAFRFVNTTADPIEITRGTGAARDRVAPGRSTAVYQPFSSRDASFNLTWTLRHGARYATVSSRAVIAPMGANRADFETTLEFPPRWV
ncbi:MAG: hypothetical protein LC745_07175 [Planctomycetia bacterium]|nr:hypothetical protein [Planctomycetia bacterium]